VAHQRSEVNFSQIQEKIEQILPPPSEAWKKCLRSLSFLEMDNRLNDIDRAADGTCEWLVQHDVYKDWAARDRSLLWIKGKPGSGKSTLLQYALRDGIITSATTDRVLVLSFFFHGRGAELQKSLVGCFRSLLHQILSHVPNALPDLVPTFERRCEQRGEPGKGWEWSLRELQDLFRDALPKVLEGNRTWLFVDALDECGENNAVSLVKEFKSLLRGLPLTKQQFKICFSCRHFPILDFDYGFEICVEDENKEDISSYVQEQFIERGAEIPPTLPQEITDRASGVFMWARLVIEHVFELERRGEGWETIKAKIKDIPELLDNLYNDLIRDAAKDPAFIRLIQWVCFAIRPLTLRELRLAITIDYTNPQSSLEECQKLQKNPPPDDTVKRKLRTLSCGLVEFVPSLHFKSYKALESKGEVVQFIHQSVKDFFTTRGLPALDSSLTDGPIAGVGHCRLSKACLRYLVTVETQVAEIARALEREPIRPFDHELSRALERELPLLQYTTDSWIAHAKQYDECNPTQDDLMDYLPLSSTTSMPIWLQTKKIPRFGWENVLEGSNFLHVVVYNHIHHLTRRIMDDMIVDINAKTDTGYTPLSIATYVGNTTAAKLLLSKGKVDVNATNSGGRTPLLIAAAFGKLEVVQLLLDLGENKVDFNARDNYGRTAFLLAAGSGSKSVVKLFLDLDKSKVDIYARDNNGRTALLVAASKDRWHVVRLFLDLDKGKVDFNARDNNGRTAFLLAASSYSENIVKLFLDFGKSRVDFNAKDNNGRTAFLLAVSSGSKNIVKLFLDLGESRVDFNARDNNGRTAFLLAASSYSENIVKLFLDLDESRVDFNARDNDGNTAFLLAAYSRSKNVVKLFLDLNKSRVNFNARDNNGRTAFLLAACSGSKNVVKLFLDLDKSKVDLYARDNDGRTALLLAASKGQWHVVQLFLGLDEGKVDFNARDNTGNTALSAAALHGHKHNVSLLLRSSKIKFSLDDDDISKVLIDRSVRKSIKQLIRGYANGHEFNRSDFSDSDDYDSDDDDDGDDDNEGNNNNNNNGDGDGNDSGPEYLGGQMDPAKSAS